MVQKLKGINKFAGPPWTEMPGAAWILAVLALAVMGCRSQSPKHSTEGARLRILATTPIVGRATAESVTVRVNNGDVVAKIQLDLPGRPPQVTELKAHAYHDFVIRDLEPGTEATYSILARSFEPIAHEDSVFHEDTVNGRFVTSRPAGAAFSFAVFSDPHLPVPASEWLDPQSEDDMSSLLEFSRTREEIGGTFLATMESLRAARADFIICLGDMVHLPAYEFNPPFPSRFLADGAYLDLRGHLGMATAEAAFYAVIGNWDGENGWHPAALRAHAQAARRQHLPNPTPSTYAQGGGALEDYYAWTWGDTLLVVLNVMGYTTTVHTLDESDTGTATSWTLGQEQWSWLETTLKSTQEPIKMIFMHHPVGGSGGDELNSTYGRGGGRAARVGEQARLHDLMIETGVQVLFYGHDHVFTEQVVDGIHYVLPGSAGAPWKFTTEETGYEDYDPRSGFAWVRVENKKIQIEFRDLEGVTFKAIEVDG